MKQAASLNNFSSEVLLPGIRINTSAGDFFPIEQMQLMKFDGEKAGACSARSSTGEDRALADYPAGAKPAPRRAGISAGRPAFAVDPGFVVQMRTSRSARSIRRAPTHLANSDLVADLHG